MITREKAYALRAMIEKASVSLSDNDALDAVELYPAWSGDGVEYEAGKRLRYQDRLYRVLQKHTSQPDWSPDVVPALFAEVERPGEGDSPDNPIPYNNNMELYKDKYYSQDGVVYICFRDTGVPVYNPLSALVGLYVNVYQG